MLYNIIWGEKAVEELCAIPKPYAGQIAKAVCERLSVTPLVPNNKPLYGKFKGCRRLRVGFWRIIYKVDEQDVHVRKSPIGRTCTIKMKEVVFKVTQEADGGFCAEAVGYAIFTQADSWEELRENAKDATLCYFFDEPGEYMVRLQAPLARPEGSQPSITPGASRGKVASTFRKPRRGVAARTSSAAPCDTPSGLCGRRLAIPRLAPGVIDGFAPFGAFRGFVEVLHGGLRQRVPRGRRVTP
jgi:addiction module RelE/StbE family toxin